MENFDIESIFTMLKGINPIFLIFGYFLFKDKIDAWLTKKPVDPAVPATPATPPVVVTPAPVDRPVLDLITTQILPVLLPIVIKLIQDQVSKEKESKA